MSGEWVALGSLAAVVLAQTAMFAYFVGRLAGRVQSNAEAIARLQSGAGEASAQRDDVNARLTKVETTIEIEMRHFREALGAVAKGQQGLSRQLAALVAHHRQGVPPGLVEAAGDD